MTRDIKRYKNKLINILKKEIEGKNVCLLDLPNYNNPGDQLIWQGEEDILKTIRVYVAYRSSAYYFNERHVTKEDCLLIHGGGNFGDLYTKHQNFKNTIVKKFPNNKIIILPSTIYFSK